MIELHLKLWDGGRGEEQVAEMQFADPTYYPKFSTKLNAVSLCVGLKDYLVTITNYKYHHTVLQ